jgi:hypothetical protein
MKERRELKLGWPWGVLALAIGIGTLAYTHAAMNFPLWLSIGCGVCAVGLTTSGPFVVLGFYEAWKAERNKTPWPYDGP